MKVKQALCELVHRMLAPPFGLSSVPRVFLSWGPGGRGSRFPAEASAHSDGRGDRGKLSWASTFSPSATVMLEDMPLAKLLTELCHKSRGGDTVGEQVRNCICHGPFFVNKGTLPKYHIQSAPPKTPKLSYNRGISITRNSQSRWGSLRSGEP